MAEDKGNERQIRTTAVHLAQQFLTRNYQFDGGDPDNMLREAAKIAKFIETGEVPAKKGD